MPHLGSTLPLLLLLLLCCSFTVPLAGEEERSAARDATQQRCVAPRINHEQLATHQGGSLVVNNACLDGDAIVVHDTKLLDRLESGDGSGLPSFDAQRFKEFSKHYTHNSHPLRPIMGSECFNRNPHFRYPNTVEVRRAKHFSNCTVPVIIFQHWIHTFGEFFTRGPAWMWRLVVDQPILDKEVTLVLASCASLPLSQHHYQLMQPFSNHQVASWAAFASRASSHSHSNSTVEGTHTRCFSKVVLMGLDHAAWSSTYKSSQYIMEHYKAKGMVPDSKLFESGPTTLKILFGFRAADSHVHGGVMRPHNVHPLLPDHPEVERMRASEVVKEPPDFKTRPVFPGVRQILNLADVLKECNSYNGWAEVLQGTKYTGVECRAYSFGRNLFEGMAVAQQTDVFMSMHGSGEMNSMFMRPNTIKIQLRSKEFGTLHRWMANGYWPSVCAQSDHPFLCFFLNFDEDDTWEPGILERFGLWGEGERDSFTRRDRHLRLKFPHLVQALKEYLPLQTNKAEFLKRWDTSKIALTFNANNTVTYFQHISRRAAERRQSRYLRGTPKQQQLQQKQQQQQQPSDSAPLDEEGNLQLQEWLNEIELEERQLRDQLATLPLWFQEG